MQRRSKQKIVIVRIEEMVHRFKLVKVKFAGEEALEKIVDNITTECMKESLLKVLNYRDDELNNYCIEKINKTLKMISK